MSDAEAAAHRREARPPRTRSGALNRAARSGFWTAQFLGTASKKTKITTTSNTVATSDARRRRTSARARTPTRVAETSWQISTSRSTGFRNCLGVLDQARPAAGPRGGPRRAAPCAFTRACAPGVSARARKPEPTSSTTMTTTSDPVAPLEPGGGDHSARPPVPVRGARASGRARAPPSARPRRRRSWSMPEQVQEAVHDQQRHLVVVADPVLDGVARGDRRADHDVAQEDEGVVGRLGCPGRCPRGRGAAARAAARPRSGSQHVGRAVRPGTAGSARRSSARRRRAATPRRRPRTPWSLEHRPGQGDPALEVDRVRRAARRRRRRQRPSAAPSARRARRPRRCRPRSCGAPRRAG